MFKNAILKNVVRTAAERGILYFDENGVLQKKHVSKYPYKSEQYHAYWAKKIDKIFKEKYGCYAINKNVGERDVKIASDKMKEGEKYDTFVERVIASTKLGNGIYVDED